ncbi:MAG: FixG Ig-like domain-containing protein [Rhodocyclaceae bacterium]
MSGQLAGSINVVLHFMDVELAGRRGQAPVLDNVLICTLRLMNLAQTAQDFEISVSGITGLRLVGERGFTVAAGGMSVVPVMLAVPEGAMNLRMLLTQRLLQKSHPLPARMKSLNRVFASSAGALLASCVLVPPVAVETTRIIPATQ